MNTDLLPVGAGAFLGRTAEHWVWGGAERSTLILGPSRSGKTSSLVIPNVLAAPGAVVSTSTKPDVLWRTAAFRGELGWSCLFDPSGTVDVPPGVQRIGWSPLATSGTWDRALVIADSMVSSTHRGTRQFASEHAHWNERAAALLAPILHAAALDGRPMADVLRWVDRHDGLDALDILGHRRGIDSIPSDLLTGILSTDARELSGIWSTASGVLSAYRSAAALASTSGPLLDIDAFCSGRNTLYLCASGTLQSQFAPLFVGLLRDIRDASFDRWNSADRGRQPPPVTLALDEVANIAPIPDLPALVSEGPGQGLLTLACVQDLSQAADRWGHYAESFLSLFGSTAVLPGIADRRTLESLSLLSGDAELPTWTVGMSKGADGKVHPSWSVGTVQRRRLPPDVISRGREGSALVLDARNRLGWVGLTPAHDAFPWRNLSRGPMGAHHRDFRDREHSPVPCRERW